VLKEMAAAKSRDVAAFDTALFGHARHVVANKLRAFASGLTGARFVSAPPGAAPDVRRYYRQLSRMSSALAFVSDVSMLVLGGSLKRREKISARLGDVLAMLYLGSATLKRFEDDGRPAADLPLLHWSMQDALARASAALHGVLANYPNRLIAAALRVVVFPLGRPYAPPSDALGHEVARLLITPSAARDRLTEGMYLPKSEADPIGCLEAAFEAAVQAEAIEAKLRAAAKAGDLEAASPDELVRAGVVAHVITVEEEARLKRFAKLRDEVIRVDDFPQDLGLSEAQKPVPQRAAA
jgi:acyl-CoA dehydrogenase